MSSDDAHQKCMICRAIGFVVAAIVVGLITWWLFGKVTAWLAILAFLGLFAFSLWLVLKYCGEPVSHVGAHSAATGGVAAGAAAASMSGGASADAPAKVDPEIAAANAEAAKAKADAEAKAAAKAKAEANAAAAAKAKADADARAAKAKAKSEADAAAAKAKAEADAAAAQSSANEMSQDYDGDGVLEGANEGTRPAALDGPRGGKADDLKQVKGIGPKMEKLCNSLGFYHFDQIAAWTPDEVAWVDANLEGFKGRVTRDTWVEQAKLLAAGGETEFSQKVSKGDVY